MFVPVAMRNLSAVTGTYITNHIYRETTPRRMAMSDLSYSYSFLIIS